MTVGKKLTRSDHTGVPGISSTPNLDLNLFSTEAAVSQGERIELQKDQSMAREATSVSPRSKQSRKATRYPLASSALIRWLGGDGDIHEALGTVRDISTCGVFVESTSAVHLGSNIELEMTPPGLRPNRSGPELHFEGKVVRVESRNGSRGFAVAGFLSVSKPGGPVC
jgi:hypothetical protein